MSNLKKKIMGFVFLDFFKKGKKNPKPQQFPF
jgi:hypothetical protein